MGIEFVKDGTSKRTFGWIQDPGKFSNLRRVVATFIYDSEYNNKMKLEILPNVVNDEDLRNEFIQLLDVPNIDIKYKALVGNHRGGKSRKFSVCNGIIQAAVPGQVREFIGDWPADNFLRWAHALGFLDYINDSDSFVVTEEGEKYISADEDSEEEKEILIDALLKYPPVHRILSLLRDGSHLTKFDIGSQLGFVGEGGFTSLPQNIFIMNLALTTSKSTKSSMRADWEGSSDKYARMICGWLAKVGLVTKQKKRVSVFVGTDEYIEDLSQAYLITPAGFQALRRLEGKNKKSKVVKSVHWEMLATKISDRNYVRTRRGYLIYLLAQSSSRVSLNSLQVKMSNYGFSSTARTISDDLIGLSNIGLNIDSNERGYRLLDVIDKLNIPLMNIKETKLSDVIKIKESLTDELLVLPHKYLSLIDLAYDGGSNRQFEMDVVSLLVNEVGFNGAHLGGARKPDGVIYTRKLENNFGVVIDTKSYSGGYSLPINQADEMRRYVEENNVRTKALNNNEWWTIFPNEINDFAFTFVSSEFSGNFVSNLNNIVTSTSTNGSVINVVNLLRLAEKIVSKEMSIENTYSLFTSNDEITIS